MEDTPTYNLPNTVINIQLLSTVINIQLLYTAINAELPYTVIDIKLPYTVINIQLYGNYHVPHGSYMVATQELYGGHINVPSTCEELPHVSILEHVRFLRAEFPYDSHVKCMRFLCRLLYD